jgi:glutamate synthase domain-containing protein 2
LEKVEPKTYVPPRTGFVNSYQRIPEPPSKEFWNRERIEHIRALAITAHAVRPWSDHSNSYRVLDRVAFPSIDPIKSNEEFARQKDTLSLAAIDSSSKLAYGRITVSAPLYLGDMSFGALSGVPNIALARAADNTGVLTGTGEGGLHPEVAKCKRITVQWASARFGVDIDVLNTGMGIVIKIGQGAKPGIGGHLPGAKVTEPISLARRIPIGRDAISPAPHHDIYSIEDLGQRIWALKEATGKPVFVKVGVTNYIPYIASGIARMGADGIIMDGQGAGTGAAPSVVKDNVGLPIDLCVASVDKVLRDQGLRKGFSIIVAGMVSSAEDTAKLMALGADIVSIGTGALIAIGCLMVHKCHLGFCPALITNKIDPKALRKLDLDTATQWVTNLVLGWKEEFQFILRELGLTRADDLVGRRDLLRGYNMNEETAKVLDIKVEKGRYQFVGKPAPKKQFDEETYWAETRRDNLQELAGTQGKGAGEAVISSMGTIAGPFIEDPRAICDWLRTDGAQVTRPSIDPYREEIETSCYLAAGRIRLSNPVMFARLPMEPESIHTVFARGAYGMGLLFDEDDPTDETLKKYGKRLIVDGNEYLAKRLQVAPAAFVVNYPGTEGDWEDTIRRLRVSKKDIPIYVRVPASEEIVPKIGLIARRSIAGIIVDWDFSIDGWRTDLEIALSQIDMALREERVDDEPLRSSIDLLAFGSRVRGADDIFKLIALGADAVGISKAALIALGYERGMTQKFDFERAEERLENLVFGLRKEVKLLAGAAGVSSIHTSIIGNRELLRSVDLEPEIRRKLRVKPGGAP